MKKTQILSAIALAFALGVVAPIAVAENASAFTAAGKESAENAITAAKKSFGTVTLASGEKVDGYSKYASVDGMINKANKVVTDAMNVKTSTAGSASRVLKDNVQAAVDKVTKITLSQEVQDAMASSKWTNGTYEEVVEIAKAIRAEYAASFEISKEKDQAQDAMDEIDAAFKASQAVLDKAVADDTTKDISKLVAEYKALTGDKDVTAPKTVAELKALIAKVEAALPQMNRYRAVYSAIYKLNKAIEDGEPDDVIANLISILNAAVAGTGNGTSNPADKDDAKAPATGIVGTAEGTATTVSIVAGLATALTALGAGVVAYRSARRK